MTFEELKGSCRDIIQQISPDERIGTDSTTLEMLSGKLSSEFNIPEFKLEYTTSHNECIIYSFKKCNTICKSGFVYEPESFDDKLSHAIHDIIDCNEALDMLNQTIEDNSAKEHTVLSYVYGRGEYCTIYKWDYTEYVVGISKKSLANLLDMYRNSNEKYKLLLSNIKTSDCINDINIIDFIIGFNTLGINQKFGFELETPNIEVELSKEALNRDDVLQIVKDNCSKIVQINTVDVIKQLGTFVALVNWHADPISKSITTKIVGERVIDVELKEVVYNYSICSRIEQLLKLSDDEIAKIYNG